MKKRISAALCAVVLLSTLLVLALSTAAAAEEKVYFMAVNETVLDLNDDTMPRVVGGALYVPYTLFDPNTAGASLGLFSSYNRTTGQVVIYSRNNSLIFDLNADNSSAQGTIYRDKAIIRNSMVFVPVDAVCRFFDLQWSLLTVEYGYVVRVKNSSVVLDDRAFTDAAYFAVRARYSSYIQSKTPVESPSTPPEEATPSQPVTEDDTGDLQGSRVYLAFRMEDGAGMTDILDRLERYGVYGVFFCRPEEMSDRDDDIRSLVAAGHQIGLLLDGATLDEQREQAVLGQQLLAHIARTETALCLSENLADADRVTLSEELCLWNTTLDATPGERSLWQQVNSVTGAVRAERRYFVLMDDSAQSAQALRSILSDLTEEGCEFRLATEITLDLP